MTQTSSPEVYVVDDDRSVRESLEWLIGSIGLSVRAFSKGQEFLDGFRAGHPACLLLDVRMPGISGLDMLPILREKAPELAVIVITGHADVPMAIRAMKEGAFDFIEKPYNDQALLDRIHTALDRSMDVSTRIGQRQEIRARLEQLTPREREVLDLVVDGNYNKVIAGRLGMSVKTVEFHRSNLMQKMAASSLSDLVRMVVSANPPDS